MSIQTPMVSVVYQGKDITTAISPMLTEFEYVDNLEGESDSLTLVVEDTKRRWQNAWYPQFGDMITVQLGYADAPLLPCGDFEVDEVEFEGPPDTVRIKALSTGVKRSVRTHNGRAYENTTLADIATTVAQRNKLTLAGTIGGVKITRVTQVYETDLTFLKRVAESYGYSFSIRGAKLCFFKRADLKAATPTLTITRQQVTSFRFHDKVRGVVKAVTVSYHNPKKKTTHRHTSNDPNAKSNAHSADELKLNVRVEDDHQAELKADAALDKNNEDQTGGMLTLPGQIKLMSGVNINLSGFGVMDGKYTVTQARHRVSRSSGYTSEVDLKRVRDPQAAVVTGNQGAAS
jgi:phage protein D